MGKKGESRFDLLCFLVVHKHVVPELNTALHNKGVVIIRYIPVNQVC